MTSTKVDKAEMKPFASSATSTAEKVHGRPAPTIPLRLEMNGTFSIDQLPTGSYTLGAWHEKYGQQEQQVTVGPKEQKQVIFTFKDRILSLRVA